MKFLGVNELPLHGSLEKWHNERVFSVGLVEYTLAKHSKFPSQYRQDKITDTPANLLLHEVQNKYNCGDHTGFFIKHEPETNAMRKIIQLCLLQYSRGTPDSSIRSSSDAETIINHILWHLSGYSLQCRWNHKLGWVGSGAAFRSKQGRGRYSINPLL